jgi:acyl-coenzyme A thioesterase PaaI-like protein
MSVTATREPQQETPAVQADTDASGSGEITLPEPPFPAPAATSPPPATWVDRVEAFLSRLSTRDNFWHRVFSLLFLPLAFWSGIRMKKTGVDRVEEDGTGSFTAILPFKKFNKNWYNAMAGASLLANTEIAAGMYVFGEAGGDYTVVCKNLNYTFLRPCLGPAVYRMTPRDQIKPLVEAGTEFNISLDVDVRQLSVQAGEREKRVGRAEITFHVTPKQQVKQRKQKLKVRDKQRALLRKKD